MDLVKNGVFDRSCVHDYVVFFNQASIAKQEKKVMEIIYDLNETKVQKNDPIPSFQM